jgi:hypothetical protein
VTLSPDEICLYFSREGTEGSKFLAI